MIGESWSVTEITRGDIEEMPTEDIIFKARDIGYNQALQDIREKVPALAEQLLAKINQE